MGACKYYDINLGKGRGSRKNYASLQRGGGCPKKKTDSRARGEVLRKSRSITEGEGAKDGPKMDYVILARPLMLTAHYA